MRKEEVRVQSLNKILEFEHNLTFEFIRTWDIFHIKSLILQQAFIRESKFTEISRRNVIKSFNNGNYEFVW